MHAISGFLLRYGYLLLLGWIFAEQLGFPVPSLPLLLAAGALAGTGRLSFWLCLLGGTTVALAADLLWYELGRAKGIKVLQFLCKISLEPDSCVRRTEGLYQRQGARTLLVAKFLPGLSAVAPPLAGVFRMKPQRFLIFDLAGAFLWVGSLLGAGFLFSDQIERIMTAAAHLGSGLLAILIAVLVAYIVLKFVARRRFLRQLRIARITPDELKQKIDAGEEVVIVDLRHSLDFEADPETIPGAFRMDAKELQAENGRLPRDREVVLYCT